MPQMLDPQRKRLRDKGPSGRMSESGQSRPKRASSDLWGNRLEMLLAACSARAATRKYQGRRTTLHSCQREKIHSSIDLSRSLQRFLLRVAPHDVQRCQQAHSRGQEHHCQQGWGGVRLGQNHARNRGQECPAADRQRSRQSRRAACHFRPNRDDTGIAARDRQSVAETDTCWPWRFKARLEFTPVTDLGISLGRPPQHKSDG